MATTKIWTIKDSLSRVVNYAQNPEKTVFSDLKQVLKYAENDEKTIEENEKMMYVTGVNCNRETAYEEMIAVQKRFDKYTGNVAYHAYQSFKTGEVLPELAHKIGVELANQMWPEHQVIVATHFNTGTYHNHFVVNSVNMFTGKKFNCNKGAYYRFRGLSDELCRENNLVVIDKPKKRTPRNIYFAEKRGEPTKYNLMRKAIDESIEMSLTFDIFKNVMYKKGYIINNDPNRKYATIRSINDKKTVRMYRLGEEYLLNNIKEKIYQNNIDAQDKYRTFINQKKDYKKYQYKGKFKDISKMSGLQILFIILFYMLGISVKQEQRKYTPLSPEMKREVRKMNRFSEEVRLVVPNKIKTIGDVKDFISHTEDEMEKIINLRQKYRNKLRHCTDEVLIKEYKKKRDDCTLILSEQRKDLKTAYNILEDVPEIKQVIKIEKQMKVGQDNIEREKYKIRGKEQDIRVKEQQIGKQQVKKKNRYRDYRIK